MEPITYNINIPDFRGMFKNWLLKASGTTNMSRRELSTRLSSIVSQNEFSYDSGYMDIESRNLAAATYANPIAQRNISLRARIIAMAKLQVEERDPKNPEGWLQVEAHPFEAIIEEHPNSHMSGIFAWSFIISDLDLFGRAYWLLVPNLDGELVEMWPIPSDRVFPIADEKEFVAGYKYYPYIGGKPEFLPARFVAVHKHVNPFSLHDGLSPIISALLPLDISQEMDKTDRGDIADGLNLSQIVALPTDTTPEQFETLKSDLLEGIRNGDRFRIIQGDDIEVTSISQQRNGAFTKAINDISSEKIDGVYGVPSGLWAKDANRANMEGAMELLINWTCWGLASMLAQDLTTQVIHRFYSTDLRTTYEDFRIKNRELELDEDKFSLSYLTYDEIRASKGLPPHSDPVLGNSPASAIDSIALELIRQGGQQFETSTAPEAATQDSIPEIEEEADQSVNDGQVNVDQEFAKSVWFLVEELQKVN